MLPFTIDDGTEFTASPGDWIYIPGVREKLANAGGASAERIEFDALLICGSQNDGAEAAPDVATLKLYIGALTDEEREIILSGCLMNYYAAKNIG
jgi:aconitate hydratase